MKKILLSFFTISSMTAMAQTISVTTFTPVQTPPSTYDRIGHLNSMTNGGSIQNPFQYFPIPVPQTQSSTPKTQLVKGIYFDGRNWKTASVRLAEDSNGMYIYSTNSEGVWQRCNKSYLREISQYDDMSKYFNYSAKGGIYTFYF